MDTHQQGRRAAEKSGREAFEALAMFAGVLLICALQGTDGSNTIVGVVSFCLVFMVIVAGSLVFVEEHRTQNVLAPMVNFCVPAVAVLGFSLSLLAAAGLWTLSALVFGVALGFATYRQAVLRGRAELIPNASLDLGLIGGLGAVAGGVLLTFVAWIV